MSTEIWKEFIDIGRWKKGAEGRMHERFYIPLHDNNTRYFDAFLKINGMDEQCPDFPARKSSGDCPFYFAGGKCRKCKAVELEQDGIIRAWTVALNPYPFGFYEVSSVEPSDPLPDQKKANRHFLQRFLYSVLRFFFNHLNKGGLA